MKDALSYTLSAPVSTVIVGCDNVAQVEENVHIAREFRPLPRKEMLRIEDATACYARDAAFFKRGASGFALAYNSHGTD